ncbi:MAG: hypothetical protein J5769_02930 [Bacteroidales bacterium]|nr:hypothetical protein [Bacteroidales bacterium]
MICFAALCSCTQEAPAGSVQGTLTLSVVADFPSKAQTDAEISVHNLFITVFDSASGKLERTLDLGAASTATIYLNPGYKTIWAYANHSVSAAGTTLASQPLTGTGGLAADSFGTEGFAMRGSASVMVPAGGTVGGSLYLDRCASRVVVKSITNNLPGNLPLTITGAYLADAYMADTPGSVLADGSLWANKWGLGTGLSAPSAATLEANASWFGTGLPYTITNGATWTVPQPDDVKGPRMYCMPNTATANGSPWTSGATWTPLVTKLVLIARIGTGTPFYYSIPLPNLSANESREYLITIFGIGTTDPELPAGTLTCTLATSSLPYTPGSTYTEDL